MLRSVDVLAQRIDLLERTYVGSSSFEFGAEDSVLSRIESLHRRFQALDTDIPAFKACYEAVIKLKPMIQEKKASALMVSQKVEGLLASKEALQSNMNTLLKIGELSSTILSDEYRDTNEWVARLTALDNSLTPLISEVRCQTEEIDELLNLYEQAMEIMSSVCSSWEMKLKDIASRKSA